MSICNVTDKSQLKVYVCIIIGITIHPFIEILLKKNFLINDGLIN